MWVATRLYLNACSNNETTHRTDGSPLGIWRINPLKTWQLF